MVRWGRGYVKIGVIAPRGVGIYRSEITRLNREAQLPDWSGPKVEQTVRKLRGWLDSAGRTDKPTKMRETPQIGKSTLERDPHAAPRCWSEVTEPQR